MEADLVLVGSEQGGRVLTLSVEEGDRVEAGDPIFTLESAEQEASVAAAKARLREAEARLADAKAQVQRPDEIEVLEASLAQAQAMLQVAANNLERARALFEKGWITKAQLDEAIAQHDRTEGAVQGGEASRSVRHDRSRRSPCRGHAPRARRGREDSRQAQGFGHRRWHCGGG